MDRVRRIRRSWTQIVVIGGSVAIFAMMSLSSESSAGSDNSGSGGCCGTDSSSNNSSSNNTSTQSTSVTKDNLTEYATAAERTDASGTTIGQ